MLIAYKAHERIFKAVASRNPDLAERAMAAHLKQLYRVYERVRASFHAKPAIDDFNSMATRRLSSAAS